MVNGRYGYFVSRNSYLVCEPREISSAIYKLRHFNGFQEGIRYIDRFGSYEVTRIKDVSLGYDSSAGQRAEDKFVSPSAEMITFELGNGTVMTLRGSGTEPKLKYYIEAKGRSIEEAEEKARDVEKALTLMLEEVTS